MPWFLRYSNRWKLRVRLFSIRWRLQQVFKRAWHGCQKNRRNRSCPNYYRKSFLLSYDIASKVEIIMLHKFTRSLFIQLYTPFWNLRLNPARLPSLAGTPGGSSFGWRREKLLNQLISFQLWLESSHSEKFYGSIPLKHSSPRNAMRIITAAPPKLLVFLTL